MSSELLLEIKNLNIEFHDHALPESVVEDVCLQVSTGEIVGIVGESGSGKSMTAMAIAGLLRRHDMKKSGEIIFEGEELLHASRSLLRKYQGNDISIVFQEPMTSLNPVKRIGWQVEESLRIHHPQMSKEERYQRAIESLRSVELSEPEKVYHQYPHELSGGMRQRVMIASAMICEPKLLIADEPTTALDVTIQLQIVKLLKRLNQEKKTSILFISHDLSLVKRLCDRIVVMQKGRIVETGNPKEIFEQPREEYTKQLIAAIPRLEKPEV
ncbi:MAG: ABC transporter ATP-binding protein [Lachnospiraceae bacterium]|nr:ABC transporter ATP-binding protein [Lachnospiraceae bacterium]